MLSKTASKLQLLSICNWPFYNYSPNLPTSIYAARGTRIDQAVQSGLPLEDQEEEAIAKAVRDMVPFGTLFQVCFGYKDGKFESLSVKERNYPPGYVAGTIDMVCGNRVIDLKTGRQSHLPSPLDSFQLRHAAEGVHQCFGVPFPITLEYWHATENGVAVTTAPYTRLDSVLFLQELNKHLEAPVRPPIAGTHCRGLFCPAYGTTCPITSKAAQDNKLLPVLAHSDAIQSPAQAAQYYQQLTAIDDMSKKAWAKLDEYARLNSFETFEGRYGAKLDRRESLKVTPEAEEILHLYGIEPETKKTLSKEAIKKITSAQVGAGKERKALEEEILKKLRLVGALKVAEIETVGIIK